MKFLPLLSVFIFGVSSAFAGPIDNARALVKAGKTDEAIAALEIALRAPGPEKSAIAIELANTQVAAGRIISAQQTMENFVRDNPQDSRKNALLLLSAQLQAAAGNSGEALSIFRKLAEQQPPIPERADALVGAINAASVTRNTAMVDRSLLDFVTAFPKDARSRDYLLSLYRIRFGADHAKAAEAAHLFRATYPNDPASTAVMESYSLSALGGAKNAVDAFESERKQPTYQMNPTWVTQAMNAMRRDATTFALIEPLASEYAAATGDPSFQIMAMDFLSQTDQASKAVELGNKLFPTLGNTGWGWSLRLSMARALAQTKNYPEAERMITEYLTENPANDPAWNMHWDIVNAAQHPDAHGELLERMLASLPARKNLTLRMSAQSVIRYRQMLFARAKQNPADMVKYMQLFFDTDGLSSNGQDVLRYVVEYCMAGVGEALNNNAQAEAALKAVEGGQDEPQKEAARTRAEEAKKKQADAIAEASAKYKTLLASIEKYLTRTVAWGPAADAINETFKPMLTLPIFTEEAKQMSEMLDRVNKGPLGKDAVAALNRAAPQNQAEQSNAAAAAFFPKFLEAGPAMGLEGGAEIINIFHSTRAFDKVIEYTKLYLAKFPGATSPLLYVGSAAQQIGQPKNAELPAFFNSIVEAAGGSYWPYDIHIRDYLFNIAEQNQQPAEMEAQYNLINAVYPGEPSFDKLRRIGVVYVAKGDVEKGKQFMLAAAKIAQATGDDLSILQSIATTVPDSTEWLLPMVDAYLARPNRGPTQAAVQLLRAQLLANKKDIEGAKKAVDLAIAHPVELNWNAGGVPANWTDTLLAPMFTTKPAEATPEQVALLKSFVTAYGPRQGNWMPELLVREAQIGQNLEFAELLNGWMSGMGPADAGVLAGVIMPLAQQLSAINKPELAAVVMRNAVQRFTEVDPKLRAQASQALLTLNGKSGIAEIEIDPNLEWAPLLRSVASYRAGDVVAAWKSFQENEALFDKFEDKVPADYLRWVSGRLLQRDDDASRDKAEKSLRRWIIANEASTAIPADEKAKTQFQLADIYFKTLRYDLARSEFQSLVNRAPGTPEAVDAQFRIGECYLNQKMYPDAGNIFENLAKSKDKLIVSRSQFLLGVLAQQRGDTEDAKARFRSVMELAPSTDVADAILYRLSELYGQENRFSDELTLLRSIGMIGSNAKQWHPPGTPLNIVIQDADLGVSRGQTHVPVAVTTSGGDREVVELESGSAGKGFFRAELPTELGAPKPGDHVLQVTGADVITYDYPDDFKKQFASIAPPRSNIRLASDAEFKISATEIKEEQEVSFEDRLREQRRLAGKVAGLEFRQEFRQGNALKPGNNIYIQVADADRDVSNEPDTINVQVTAASGSHVSVPVVETGPHTGLFRGTLGTVEIAANIFATDRSEGNDAVRAIDNNPGTAWEARNDGVTPKSLVIDLKKPTKLGELKWMTDSTSDKVPTEFSVQVAPDLEHWKTVAATAGVPGATPEQTQRLTSAVDGNVTRGTVNLAGEEGRYVRLLILKYNGSAPRIAEVEITEAGGARLIPGTPVAEGVAGEQLRLTPSDRISAVYEDEANMASVGKPRSLNQDLQATYYDARIGFIAYEYKSVPGRSEPVQYVKQVRRVEPGERVVVRISDYDADLSDKRDKVKFVLKTADGKETPMEATETEPFSGVFTKEFDIWSPEHPDGLKIEPGQPIQAIYLDEQNTQPGAPTNRTAILEAVTPGDAKVAFMPSTVNYSAEGEESSQYKSVADEKDAPAIKPVSFYPPLTFEVFDPASAKDSFSEITVTVTTSAGSKVDIICPLATFPNQQNNEVDDALEKGRFVGQIFMALGDKDSPQTSVLELGDTRTLIPRRQPSAAQDEQLANVVPVLNLNGQDIITATFKSHDKEFTDQARLIEPATVAFTDSTYEEPVKELYIGDKIYLSVKDLTADATAEPDNLDVNLSTPRGEKFTVTLKETLGHSGQFTGSFPLVPGEKPTPGDDKMEAWFGDPISLTYVAKANPDAKVEKKISVVKGTDGKLLVFEKKYATENVAIESQFRMAEAYFELFKNYRSLKQTEQANTALSEGMQLLKELSEDYPSKAYEARTDYLLGQFAQELKKYDEAIAYYKGIVQNHSEHPLAPDAQYKLGQCYEEKGDMDAASAEYVTLAYTWPENPLVSNVIVRIAEYFYNKKEYPTAAEVSKKFVDRFPQHEWAEKMLFRSAQCWFKADKFEKAGKEFDLLVENYPRGKFRPDAIFWAGESYRSAGQSDVAFRRYKRVTWDYPESDAAKFARGKLVLPEMVNISDKEAQ